MSILLLRMTNITYHLHSHTLLGSDPRLLVAVVSSESVVEVQTLLRYNLEDLLASESDK